MTHKLSERKRKGQGGFTLIELMIVVAIIAILAAVAIPNFLRARYRSNFTACLEQLKNISTGMQTFISEKGDLTDVTDENDICHHLIPGADEPADCDGQIKTRVNSVCDKDTLSVTIGADGFQYDIYAKAKGKDTPEICVTETGVDPPEYGEAYTGCPHP